MCLSDPSFSWFYLITSSKMFTWILLSVPFSPMHLLWKGQPLHTVLAHRYSFVTVFVVRLSRCRGSSFFPGLRLFFLFSLFGMEFPLSPFSFAFYTIINEDFGDKTPCIRRSLSMPCKQNIADKIIYIFASQLPAEFNFVILCLACSLCSLLTALGLR